MRELLTTYLAIAVLAGVQAYAQNAGSKYPKMAAVDQYLMTEEAEVDLARTAAPESISKDADVLALGKDGGYRMVIKGKNGFVCLVQRSWTAGLDDPDFWNPKLRAPICFNPAGARTYLPRVVKRTRLVFAGKTKEQLPTELKAAFDAKEIPAIESGAMGYMMSKHGYLSDRDGHWHPHIMFYVPPGDAAVWGAGLPGSPIFGASDPVDRVSIFFMPVNKWSDGLPDSPGSGSH
jgi:hypothetical protein